MGRSLKSAKMESMSSHPHMTKCRAPLWWTGSFPSEPLLGPRQRTKCSEGCGANCQTQGSVAGIIAPVPPSNFRLLSILLTFHYLQAAIMSQVIDPNSANSEVNCHSSFASLVVTPSTWVPPGGELGSGSGEPRH